MNQKLIIGDFYCGMKGWSQAFKERGHKVITYDNNPIFCPDVLEDLLKIFDFPKLDGALFSPPCHTMTTMRMGRNWTHENQSKTKEASNALDLVKKCQYIISVSKPEFFIIENPRARLRTLGTWLDKLNRQTITMCRYGIDRMKPTDLWGGFPPSWKPREMCWNYNPDHRSAWRGSMTGTQGMNSAEAAKIPYQLSLEICIAMEKDIARENIAPEDYQ